MGVVYKAEDTKLNRTVALKFLPPELTRDPEAKQRFIQEARAASALDHPNICTIHEIGEADDGQLYIVMACYDGETLKRRIERGRCRSTEAMDIAIQVAAGLTRAHEAGIVHRDIKPANIMVTDRTRSRSSTSAWQSSAGETTADQDRHHPGHRGLHVPGAGRGELVDPRTDIWSLGVVLYEMLTGKRAFQERLRAGTGLLRS